MQGTDIHLWPWTFDSCNAAMINFVLVPDHQSDLSVMRHEAAGSLCLKGFSYMNFMKSYFLNALVLKKYIFNSLLSQFLQAAETQTKKDDW